MTIRIGDPLPDGTVKTMTPDGPRDVSMKDLCASGTAVIFAVPGAFTPACSARHLPGFLEKAADLTARGVGVIACISVNDAFVMDAWARANGVKGRIVMLADGNGAFTRALGLDADLSPFGMGVRSQRFAMVVKNGRVAQLFVDEPGAFEVSAAGHVLAHL
ncbi:MAG: peroxiredoxin [Rhodospirillaceae bacterium]|nr:peroxiredoxin [Rhodospirillaceae bacterium]